jgi:hypothetical protein
MSGLLRVMKPAGPVAQRFIDCTGIITGIMGPVGGGKTTAAAVKCIKAGMRQRLMWDERRGCFVKRCRVGVVRDTYPNLDRTVIKTWREIFRLPNGKMDGRWSWGAPRIHEFTMHIGQRGKPGYYQLDMEVLFIAIGEHSVEDVLRGLELTVLWPNELDLLPRSIIEIGIGRIGRYPSKLAGGCPFSQIFADFNAPDEDNWVYDLFIDQNIPDEVRERIADEIGADRPLIAFHRQPGAREPSAENLHNLEKGYYAKQLLGMRPDKIARLIDNKFGAVRAGMPVYPEFSDTVHVVADARPVKGIPLRIGMDAGLTPAAVIAQQNAFGQTVILAELAWFVANPGDDLGTIGPTAFGEALADLLQSQFPGFDVEWAVCDPAAARGTDGSGNEMTWLQIAAKAAGLRIRPAPVANNSIDVRLEAVRRPLKRLIDAGRPALVISSRCKVLRRGFNSGYVFRRTALAGGDDRYENKPVKNQYSHVHDAAQYLMVASGEGRIVADAMGMLPWHKAAPPKVESDYRPFS